MRIAYISLHWSRTLTSGVGKKIARQIDAWRSAGHEVEFFMHSTEHAPELNLVPGQNFYYPQNNKINMEWGRIRAARHLLEAVKSYKPDIIHLRYGMYVHPIQRLTFIAPVVEEINTNDITQHNELGKLYSLYNQLTRGILLNAVSGLIAMTNELAADPAFASYKKPTCVIANGIEMSSIQPFEAPNNRIPHVIFTATPGYYWHGVEKLITLAKNHPDLIIEVAGYDHIPGITDIPNNLKLLGYLQGVEYKQALARADISLGTLALHRKGMQEACPLKTREYLAYGIPMVIPYIDSDLHDLDSDCLLKIPNTEDNIQTHGKIIRDFAYQMRGKRVNRAQISKLDDTQKEIERIAFFQKIIESSQKNRSK